MIKNIGTHIKVSDFAKSKTFYETLGFVKMFEYGPDKTFTKDAKGNLISAPEGYNGVTFMHGGCILEIADGHRAVKPEVFKTRVTNSKISLMISVDNLRHVIHLAEKAHIPIIVKPRHYYWGKLELVIKDPDGVVLVFTMPYSESEAKKINADETFGKPPSA